MADASGLLVRGVGGFFWFGDGGESVDVEALVIGVAGNFVDFDSFDH